MIVPSKPGIKLLAVGIAAIALLCASWFESKFYNPPLINSINNQHKEVLTEALSREIGFTSAGGPLFTEYSVIAAENSGAETKAYLLVMCEEYIKGQNGLEIASGTWCPVVAHIKEGRVETIERPMDGGEHRRTLERMFPWYIRDDYSWRKRVDSMSSKIRDRAAQYFAAG